MIGAGLSRTGTLSTKAALELILGKCYHGSTPFIESPEHAAFWCEALDTGTLPSVELLDGYKAGVDMPLAAFYKELTEKFPAAKVILTVRDPWKWYKSCIFMYKIISTLTYCWPYSWFVRLASSSTLCGYFQRVSGGVVKGRGQPPAGLQGRMNNSLLLGEEASVNFFIEHKQEVMRSVPPDKLLVFDVREGWEPLCQFLKVPIPDAPFPNVNHRMEIKIAFNTIRAVAWLSILMLILLIVYMLLYMDDFIQFGLLVAGGTLVLCVSTKAMEMLVRKQIRKGDKTKQI